MVSVNLQLEDTLAEQLHSVCDKKGYDQNGLIRDLIKNYVNKDDPKLLNKLQTANFSSLCGVIDSDNVG